MQNARTALFVALALIAGGVLAFFVVLALMGADPDKQPLGLFEWMMGGLLIGPGFAYLIRWRRMRDAARTAHGDGSA